MPANHRELHWAQARIYGWLLCRKLGLAQVRVALVYFDIASQKETVFVETHSADTLREHFARAMRAVYRLGRAGAGAPQRARRGAQPPRAFRTLRSRPGQRDLAAAVYRSAVARRCLMAQAPTGIGKTLGTLFPLLKALARPAVRQDLLPDREKRRAARSRSTP